MSLYKPWSLSVNISSFLKLEVDRSESSSECESSESDEEDDKENESCSNARFQTNNHVTFTNLDEIRRQEFLDFLVLSSITFLKMIVSYVTTLCLLRIH